MGFADSIKTCFQKYSDFKGRASRSEYWWFVLFSLLVKMPIMVWVIADYLLSFGNKMSVADVISWIVWIIFLLPMVTVTVRRMHDLGRSGWWAGLGFLSQVHGLFGPEPFDRRMPEWEIWFSLLTAVASIVLLVWCCTRGAAGPNRFGPDPLAEVEPEGSHAAQYSPIDDGR
jgi:uncharacterized membrane protein YhaH (DUF805 family)